MKRIFEIEFPDENGPMWMNQDNLLICLLSYCKNTKFSVRDITGDIDRPASTGGPIIDDYDNEIEILGGILHRTIKMNERL